MNVSAVQDENRELVRSLAHQRISQLHEVWKMHLNEHFHLFRWIVATLMLVNGGAAIAIFGAQSISLGLRIIAGLVFSTGVIATVIHAQQSQLSNEKKMKELQKRIAHWIEVEQQGDAGGNLEVEMVREMDELFRWPIAQHLLGWLPGVLFAIGLAIVAYGTAYGTLK